MLKKRKVLSRHSLPSAIPIWKASTCYLLLEHSNAEIWLYYLMATVFIFDIGMSVYRMFTDKEIELSSFHG